MSCWRPAIARAIPSGCCSDGMCSSRRNPSSASHRHPQSMIVARAQQACRASWAQRRDYKRCITRAMAAGIQLLPCPGGTVVAATSELRRVVTNGMSHRATSATNAGGVVGIDPGQVFPADQLASSAGAARIACLRVGGGDSAPAQLVGDFLRSNLRRSWATSRLPTSPVCVSVISGLAAGLCHRRNPRCAAGIRSADRERSRRRRADGRGTHVLAVRITRDAGTLQSLNRAACIRRAKALATPAASCPRESMASKWPRRWHDHCRTAMRVTISGSCTRRSIASSSVITSWRASGARTAKAATTSLKLRNCKLYVSERAAWRSRSDTCRRKRRMKELSA